MNVNLCLKISATLLVLILSGEVAQAIPNGCATLFSSGEMRGNISLDAATRARIVELPRPARINKKGAISRLVDLGFYPEVARNLVAENEKILPYLLSNEGVAIPSPDRDVVDNARPYNPRFQARSLRKNPVIVYRGLRIEGQLKSVADVHLNDPNGPFNKDMIWVSVDSDYAAKYAAGSDYGMGATKGILLVFQVPEFMVHWAKKQDLEDYLTLGDVLPGSEQYLIGDHLVSQRPFLVGYHEVALKVVPGKSGDQSGISHDPIWEPIDPSNDQPRDWMYEERSFFKRETSPRRESLAIGPLIPISRAN